MRHSTYYQVIKNIVLAQVASDGGKAERLGYDTLGNAIENILHKNIFSNKAIRSLYDSVYRANYGAYGLKNSYILRALATLSHNPYCGIKWTVLKDVDQNGYPAYIIYFEVKDINNVIRQVSFHAPASNIEFDRFITKRAKISWDEKSSRDNCYFLFKEVVMNMI